MTLTNMMRVKLYSVGISQLGNTMKT